MARVKLRCIMGYPGLKSSYRQKGLLKISEILGHHNQIWPRNLHLKFFRTISGRFIQTNLLSR